jgi:hypothetical protein
LVEVVEVAVLAVAVAAVGVGCLLDCLVGVVHLRVLKEFLE